MERAFWEERWAQGEIGFHQQEVHPYLARFYPQLQLAACETVLVPLCGKSHDMRWLCERGAQVLGVEFSRRAVAAFFEENALVASSAPAGLFERWQGQGISLLCGDFFDLRPEQLGTVRAVYDRAALVALPEAMRDLYAAHLTELLPADSRILLVANHYDETEMQGPPFSVPVSEVQRLYSADFSIEELASEETIATNPGLQQRGLSSFCSAAYLLCKR